MFTYGRNTICLALLTVRGWPRVKDRVPLYLYLSVCLYLSICLSVSNNNNNNEFLYSAVSPTELRALYRKGRTNLQKYTKGKRHQYSLTTPHIPLHTQNPTFSPILQKYNKWESWARRNQPTLTARQVAPAPAVRPTCPLLDQSDQQACK